MTVDSDSPTFIDLFAGAGGLSCGMEMAGWKCLLGVDYGPHAMDTFAHNHKHAKTYCGDISQLDKKTLLELTDHQQIDAVVGGPPCQGFSTAGLGDPEDARNSLFLEFVRIVKQLRPSYIVVENVTGLLAKKNIESLQSIFHCFNNLGYQLGVQVMSAHHYGTPEKRRRTIILGSLVNKEITFPEKKFDVLTNGKYKGAKTVGEAFSKIEKRKKLKNHDLEMAQIKDPMDLERIKQIPEGRGIRYERDEEEFLPPELRLGVNWTEMRENRFRQTRYQRLHREAPGPTIMTHRHSYYHPTENRYLTAREAASIQSFPLDFVFHGPISAQWRQIGNAVPPLMGKAIGEALMNMREDYLSSGKSKSRRSLKKQWEKIEDIRGEAFVY